MLIGQNPCDGFPYIYNVYEDLTNEVDPTSWITGNDDCTAFSSPYTGAYVVFIPMHWNKPIENWVQSSNPSSCYGNPNGFFYSFLETELVSFPFTPNLSRTDALPQNTARILTINDEFNNNLSSSGFKVLSSIRFINRVDNPLDEDLKIPHSILKHTQHLFCDPNQDQFFNNNESILSAFPIVVDNTRARLRYYPFLGENSSDTQPSLSAGNMVYDIAIMPFFEFTPSSEDFSFINYYPHDEILSVISNASSELPLSVLENCFYPETEEEAMTNPHYYLQPAPYSLPGFYIKGNENATVPAGYNENSTNGVLTPQSGIKHTYIVDKNYDITTINPQERIFYNPEEVEIEADNLIFPSGYTFQTVRGLPPTVSEIENLPCPEFNNLDPRFVPTDTDLPTGTYTFDNNTTVNVNPSVYILNDGSKLTIEPCVYIYGVTFIVKEGATLVYHHDQTYGNFNIIKEDDYIAENDLLAESKVVNIPLHGGCYDCRCQNDLDIDVETDFEITGDTEWIQEIKNIKGMVRVRNGAKLVINRSKVYFSDKLISGVPSGIVIEPGGKVIVTNSTLSSFNCHNMWEGITVEGNPSLPQFPESNQGVLHITGSIIEKSRLGADALKLYVPTNTGGGIIRAVNTIFRNNYISVGAGIYHSASASYFQNCLFEQTKPLKGYAAESSSDGLYSYAQALLIDSRNIQFINCTFVNRLNEDAISGAPNRGFGILAYISDFYVGEPFDPYPTTPGPNPISAQSLLKGYYKGIDTYSISGWAGRATVWRTSFTDNNYGFVGNGTNLDQITESEFYNNISDWNGQYIFFQNATNYTVAGNVFGNNNPNGNINAAVDGHGVVGRSTGTTGSRIFSNDFSNLYQGLTLEGDNTNLQIKCNSFNNFAISGGNNTYRYPWLINEISVGTVEAPLLGNQGMGCDPGQTAGNLFNDSGQFHIYAAEEVDFDYFANGTPAATVPNITGFDLDFFDDIDVTNCGNLQNDINNCPGLPDLNGFSEGTMIGNGSPEDLASDIRNNSLSEFEQTIRGAQAVQYYLQQDSTQQQAIQFLTELNTLQARTMLLSAYLQQGDTAMIRHYRLLLQADTVVNAYLKDYYKLLELVVKDGRSLYDLTEQEIVEFEALAVNDNTAAATYIQSLLAIPRLQTYDRIPQPIAQSGKRPNQITSSKNVSWFHPNPATNSISINGLDSWQNLTIYNLYGQVEANYTYSSEALPLSYTLPNGIYILSLQLRDGKIKTGKLFISK